MTDSYSIDDLLNEMEKIGAEALSAGFNEETVSLMISEGYNKFKYLMPKEILARLICHVLSDASLDHMTKQ